MDQYWCGVNNISNTNINFNSQENEFGVTPTIFLDDFHNLINFPNEEDLLKLFRIITTNLIEKTGTGGTFEIYFIFYDLRRLNKFQPGLFKSVMGLVSKQIGELISHVKPSISRVAIRLMTEIFTISEEHEDLHEWIRELLPLVVMRGTSEVQFVKEEVNSCLSAVSGNMFFLSTLETLLELSNHQNPTISTLSYQTFHTLLSQIESNILFAIYDQIEWVEFLNLVLALFGNKKEVYITRAYDVLTFLENSFNHLIGDNSFYQLINSLGNSELLSKMEQLYLCRLKNFESRQKKNHSKENIKVSRQSIKSDKLKANVKNNFWKDGELKENFNPNQGYSNSQSIDINIGNNFYYFSK
jgi:hypothetical protein